MFGLGHVSGVCFGVCFEVCFGVIMFRSSGLLTKGPLWGDVSGYVSRYASKYVSVYVSGYVPEGSNMLVFMNS